MFARPPDAIDPLDPDAIAIRLYREAGTPLDPFTGAAPPPNGVRLMSRVEPTGDGKRVASIDRVPGEALAKTIARARPWFDELEIGANRRWLFEVVRPASDPRSVEVLMVIDDPVIIRGSDIAWVHFDAGEAGGVEVKWSDAGAKRLAEATAHLVDHAVAISVADRLLWAPKLGSAFGTHDTPSRLVFMGDGALGKAIRDAVAGDPTAVDALAHDRIVQK